jgi:uracil DNA glycosylase superfamily protein
MKPGQFVGALRGLHLEDTFNPYADRCPVHDLKGAPKARSDLLLAILEEAMSANIDSLWIGRDLGYRGGRRTGLALTDDVHIVSHAARFGIGASRPTKGEAVAERTAAVIWDVLSQITIPVFLWNVFPLHPHEPEDPFSNRAHNAKERLIGEELLSQLVALLRPRRLVAIGNDAARTARKLAGTQEVIQVRHPSYGGQTQFVTEMRKLYRLRAGHASESGSSGAQRKFAF